MQKKEQAIYQETLEMALMGFYESLIWRDAGAGICV